MDMCCVGVSLVPLTLLQLASASEQVTSLSGALAAERTNGEGVSAELEQLRTANREQDILIKRQQVRGAVGASVHTRGSACVVTYFLCRTGPAAGRCQSAEENFSQLVCSDRVIAS